MNLYLIEIEKEIYIFYFVNAETDFVIRFYDTEFSNIQQNYNLTE